LNLALEAEPKLEIGEQSVWVERLEAENDNLRAALGWSQGKEEPATGLRLAGALGRFWEVQGYFTEGWAWLESVLARSQGVSDATPAQRTTLARPLCSAGRLVNWQRNYAPARTLLEESLSLYQGLGDKWGIAQCLFQLGRIANQRGDIVEARSLTEESLAIQRELGDNRGVADTLRNLAPISSPG